MIERGGIYWTEFAGASGAEIRKKRPAVVVSSDDHNLHMRTVTVAPLTSSPREAPLYEVGLPAGVVGDGRPCRIKPHQIQSVDRRRIGRRMGSLPPEWMAALEFSLRLHLGL